MIQIHVLHTGSVCVAPALPFGGEKCSPVKASGFLSRKDERLWLPVSAYLIESEHGRILFDCGWHRAVSPKGEYDEKAQIRSLGGRLLFQTNQAMLPAGEAIDEQLAAMGLQPSDLDCVLLSHLDCDHANGLKLVQDAKRILVSEDEMRFATKKTPVNQIRYHASWWEGTKIKTFDWNGTEGPVGKSYDIFDNGQFVMVNIPGHSAGLCALKIRSGAGRFALLVSDGGYAKKSWEQMILSGIADDRDAQKKSLAWIRAQSEAPNCIEVLANHDPDVKPHVIEL